MKIKSMLMATFSCVTPLVAQAQTAVIVDVAPWTMIQPDKQSTGIFPDLLAEAGRRAGISSTIKEAPLHAPILRTGKRAPTAFSSIPPATKRHLTIPEKPPTSQLLSSPAKA